MLGRPKFVLASGSPRRLSLLNQAGIEPDALRPADVDETPRRAELPRACANRLARAKADAALKSVQLDERAITRLQPHWPKIVSRLNGGEKFDDVARDLAPRAAVTPAQVAMYTNAMIKQAQSARYPARERSPALADLQQQIGHLACIAEQAPYRAV